jgi:Ca2+-binding RTX toxin-like protein
VASIRARLVLGVGAALCAVVVVVIPAAVAAGKSSSRIEHGSPSRATSPSEDALVGRLAGVAQAERSGTAAALAVARASGLAVRGGSVRVVLTGTEGAAAVADVGGVVEAEAAGKTQALVPVARLDELAGDDRSGTVRPPARFTLAATVGEGVAATNAAALHTAGTTGAGVKIAIIDGGFNGYQQRITSGDLPNTVITQDFCGGQLATATDHGTAVAEIVHEIAPGAQLYLICMNSEVTLAQAEAYAKAQGVKIINHSVGWFNTSRGDGSGAAGSPDAIVADARANGIVWVNAAGNEEQSHWSGVFNDADSDDVHEFNGTDIGNSFGIPAGEVACASLRWDAWPMTSTDFDLFLIRSSDGLVLASSLTDQAASPAPPIEELCYQNTTGVTLGVAAVITRYSAASNPVFDLFVTEPIEYASGGSVIEPASSPAALAVGAACVLNDSLQPYSSDGPTIDGRIKPDLVAPDGVSSATYGAATSCSTGFTGTSAAVPHVAGALALLLQREPGLSVPTLESLVLNAARNGSFVGDNFNTGAGRLFLPPTGSAREFLFGVQNGGVNSWFGVASQIGDGAALIGGLVVASSGPTFSPDGTKIAYANQQTGKIIVLPAEGGLPTQITSGLVSDGYPAWSPDGTKIAFTRSSGSDFEIHVMNADGSNVQRLTTSAGDDYAPTWSPDGQTIVFMSQRLASGNPDLFSMTSSGASQTRLLDRFGSEAMPVFSPDGTKIAFEDLGNDDVYVMNSDGSNVVNVTTDVTANASSPAWLPDGSLLSAVIGQGVWTFAPDGSGKTQLHTFGATIWPGLSWRGGALTEPRAAQLPLLRGEARPGARIAASRGAWVGNPVRLSYQWRRCDTALASCVDISGATDRFYVAGSADLGSKLRVRVTAQNGAGSTAALSAATNTIAVPVSPPPPPPPPSPPSGGGGGGSGAVDLALTGSVAPATTSSGGTVTWTLRATNVTKVLALGARVDVTLPAGATLVSSQVNRGPGCPHVAPTGAFSCGLDFLNDQAPTGDIRIVTTLTGSGDFVLRAKVAYVNPDPVPANDSIELKATIPGPSAPPSPPVRTPQSGKSLTGTAKANVLRGTSFADTIRGLAGNDRLFGLAGNDRLFGGPGADVLTGGPGRDTLDGGAGADLIAARDGVRDTVRCGSGRDTVTADKADAVAANCERVSRR